MKIIQVLTGLFLFPAIAFCQIPNPSFEDWTDSFPDGWYTNSSPPSLLPVIMSTDAHTGDFALKCQIVDDSGIPFGPYIQPATVSHGFPYTLNDTVLYGYYKADLIGSNLGLVEVWIYDSLLNQVGAGLALLPTTQTYTQFSIPIIYTPGSYANELSIIIQMTDTSATGNFSVGSYFLLDDLTFQDSATVNINTPEKNHYTISPNPANDHITIQGDFSNRKKQYVAIYDVTGKKLFSDNLSPLSENSVNSIDVSSIPPGCYIMLITDGERSSSKKLIINR